MLRLSKLLLDKAADSLVSAIDKFNTSNERGRKTEVLILADHCHEMLLKSAIAERRGNLVSKKTGHMIGFAECVNRASSTGNIKFLEPQHCVALRHVNGLRDAEYHALSDVSEEELYVALQESITVVRDVLREVFDLELYDWLPRRVMPVSTLPLTDIVAVFDSKMEEVKKLLAPGRRRKIEARAAVASLSVLESALNGSDAPPTEKEIVEKLGRLARDEPIENVFPAIQMLDVGIDGSGPTLSLRLTKGTGMPIRLVNADGEDSTDAAVIASRRVAETGFYKYGSKDIARKLGINQHDARSMVYHLSIQNDEECFKIIQVRNSKHKRYSQQALDTIKEGIDRGDLDAAKSEYQKQIASKARNTRSTR